MLYRAERNKEMTIHSELNNQLLNIRLELTNIINDRIETIFKSYENKMSEVKPSDVILVSDENGKISVAHKLFNRSEISSLILEFLKEDIK